MALFASSYIPTVAASVARNADNLSFPLAVLPEALTIYLRFIELNGDSVGTFTFLNIGSSNAPLLILFLQGSSYKLQYQSGTVTVTSAIGSGQIIGDTVEILATLTATGIAQISFSRNGAALSVGSATGVAGLRQTWSAATLYINSQVAGLVNFAAYRNIILARGIQSLTTMQRYAAVN